jgi:hypothetical protein
LANFLIFVDETINHNDILKLKNFDGLIFSCDISSHHRLSENKISHKLIENYISNNMIQSIENQSLDMAQNWYCLEDFEKILSFNGINFGSIIETQFYLYLLQKLKIIFGLKEILKNENPKKILSSLKLFPILKFLSNNESITITSFTSTTESKNTDKVILPLSIGKKTYNFWISKSFALKVANIFESVANIFYRLNFDIQKMGTKPSIVMLDLNPKPYEILINKLTNDSKNLIFIKDSGPISWNKHNIDILKKSNSKIFSLAKLYSYNNKNRIKSQQKKITLNLKQIFLNDFKYFTIFGICFWDFIKDEFFELCSENFNEAIKIYYLSEEFFKKINVSEILTLYNSNPFQQIFLYVANKNNVSCLRLQHGFDPLNEYLKKFLPLSLPKTQLFLKHGLWGVPSKNYLVESKCFKDNQSSSVGNPRYDALPLIKKQQKKSNKILIASSFTYTGFDLSGFDSNISELHKQTFKKICEILNKNKNKKLIVKLHPGAKTSYEIQPILDQINNKIPVFKTQNIFQLLNDCEFLVCLDFSTIILEALILGKPVIIFNVNSIWYDDDPIFSSNSIISVKNLSEFEDALNLLFCNKNAKLELIENGYKFVNSYLSHIGKSSPYLTNLVKESD